MHKKIFLIAGAVILLSSLQTHAQGTRADYDRADEIRKEYSDKTYYDKVNVNWIDSSKQMWYSVNTPKGTEYFLVDADKESRNPAFNQEKLAASLSDILDHEIKPYKLPVRNLKFEQSIVYENCIFPVKNYHYYFVFV